MVVIKLKKNIKLFLLLAVLTAAFCNQYFYIDSTRRMGSSYASRDDVVMPPSLSLVTVALGPVRGLIVDALWWRVSELQMSSEYFEIIRITDWITMMQPENGFVWTFHAWNLAYNIAYEFPSPESRWKWIYSGIKLLRDEGLKINPGNEFIESELALMFSDRVAGFSDPGRRYFIKAWTKIMGKYLKEGNRSELELLANAVPGTPEALRALALQNDLKLNLKKMIAIDRAYGPFQWKLPMAQAVYWGARKQLSEYKQGDLNYSSVVISSMELSFLFGKLIENANGDGEIITTNNFEITDNIIKYYKQKIKSDTKPQLQKNLFVNFITNSAPILYAFGKKKEAKKLFDEYKNLRPENKSDFKTFIAFHLDRMMNKYSSARYHQELVEIWLFKAYLALAKGDFKEAFKSYASAEKKWKKHQKKFISNKVLQLPSLSNLKIAAFVKVLDRFSPDKRLQLLELVHNKMAGQLGIDPDFSFKAYIK